MPNWKKLIYSGSAAVLSNVSASSFTGSFTGSFLGPLNGTSSFASTSSFVNTLNQNVLITSSLTVGSGSLGPNENTLTLGARDTANEGGQLGLNAPGGSYISASFLDLYQNRLRILKGTNAGSTGEVASWNMHTLQMSLPAYTSPSSFPGTATAALAIDSTGSIITIATSSGGSTTPGGSNTQIQYNNSNAFGGVPVLTYNGTTLIGTGSFTGSFVGALTGTASYATNADTLDGLHSNAFVTNNVTSSMLAPYLLVTNTSSFATTTQLNSYLLISNTASMIAPYLLIGNTGSMLSPYTPNSQTGSFVRNNQTSSFVQNSQTSSMLAPYLLVTNTSSFATTSQLASYLLISNTASMVAPYLLTARTSSLATTGSGTFSGSITVSSSLGVGTAAPATVGLIRATNDIVAFYSSDERLKTNKQIISNPLEKLNQINGYEFDWIPKPGIHENEGHDIGVIAQEIEKILPDIVTTRDNGYKAVKYEKIVALLIEAIKDLQTQVNELKNGSSNL